MRTYVVLGPPRTGTSLAMGLLIRLGVHAGGPMRTGRGNPNYYEHELVKEFVHQHIKAEELIRALAVADPWGMKHPRLLWRWEELKPLIPDPRFVVTYRRDTRAQYQSHRRAIRLQNKQSFRERTCKYYQRLDEVVGNHPRLNLYFEDWFNGRKSKQLERLTAFTELPIERGQLSHVSRLIKPQLKHF